MSDNLNITIELVLDSLLYSFNSKLIECNNAVFFGINSLDITTELPEILSSGDGSIFVHAPFGELSLEQSKMNFRNWILKKGFEDLISALNELLVSFASILDLNVKMKAINITTIEKFMKLINEPNDDNSKKDFPQLLDKVSGSLKEPLKYIDEIKTINRVRRCLVHRNGIVRPLDFNIENGLELKWWFYEINLVENGTKKNLEYLAVLTADSKVEVNEIQKSKIYIENEQLNFNFQEYNELILFCKRFSFDLLEKFKLN